MSSETPDANTDIVVRQARMEAAKLRPSFAHGRSYTVVVKGKPNRTIEVKP